ncbi:hypothetical protein [Citreimonas sp.]|uniref:hypothetical protein n=1 Tax=Citreimonas sp. TaxID=3036715 RepID=UPI004057F382
MTAFADLTLEEAIDVMEEAARRDPKAQELHDAHLNEVRKRRAIESGFSPDTRDPSNYQTTEQLRRRADRLSNVSLRPHGETGPTARAGSITDRSGRIPAFKVGEQSAETHGTLSRDKGPEPAERPFTRIKDSKL